MNRIMTVLYEIGWMFLAALLYGISLVPCYYLVRLGWLSGMPWGLFLWAFTPFVFVGTLILVIWLAKAFLIPQVKPGKYSLPDSPGAFAWFANRWLADILLIPFSRLIFLNDVLRYCALRALGARVPYGTAISTSNITDFDLIRIGQGSLVGGFAKMYPHLQPAQGRILLAPITIGDHSFIGGLCNLPPGVTVGDRVFIAICTTLGPFVRIDDGCRIGWHCTIGRRTHVEKNVTIGDNCRIGSNVVIREGVVIPDNSIIPDDRVIRDAADVEVLLPAQAPGHEMAG